jgi:hypothetical protein
MDGSRFDDLTRRVAGTASRRRVLAGLAASVLGVFIGGNGEVSAARPPRSLRRTRRCGGSSTTPCSDGCCAAGFMCVDDAGCAPNDAVPCNGGYCTAGQLCGADGQCLICSNRTDSCGGECGPCPAGAECREDADCASGLCTRGVCEGEAACLEWGSMCTQHDECCTGLCRAINAGGLACEQCGGEGAACGNYVYCCPGYECDINSSSPTFLTCLSTPTYCTMPPGACQTSEDCCQHQRQSVCLEGICHACVTDQNGNPDPRCP